MNILKIQLNFQKIGSSSAGHYIDLAISCWTPSTSNIQMKKNREQSHWVSSHNFDWSSPFQWMGTDANFSCFSSCSMINRYKMEITAKCVQGVKETNHMLNNDCWCRSMIIENPFISPQLNRLWQLSIFFVHSGRTSAASLQNHVTEWPRMAKTSQNLYFPVSIIQKWVLCQLMEMVAEERSRNFSLINIYFFIAIHFIHTKDGYQPIASPVTTVHNW